MSGHAVLVGPSPKAPDGYWAERRLDELDCKLRELEAMASSRGDVAAKDASVMIEQALVAVSECRAALGADDAAAAAIAAMDAEGHYRSAHFALHHHAGWLAGERSRRGAPVGASTGGRKRSAKVHDRDEKLRHAARQLRDRKGLDLDAAASFLKEREGEKLPGIPRIKRIIGAAFR